MEMENDQHDDETLHQECSVNGLAGDASNACDPALGESPCTTLLNRAWKGYCSHVLKHQVTLQLGDDILTRLLFWTPHASHNEEHISRWREVLYGLLSLHRMAMDMALHHHTNSYGTTVRPTESPHISATALRIALTVTHNLMPTVLQLARSHPRHQAIARLWLERIKFVSRLVLLVSYWNQVRSEPCNVVGGLLQDGGMYRVIHGGEECIPSVSHPQARKHRRDYVGRRTGRRVAAGSAGEQPSHALWVRLIVGEALKLYRPLYWAQAEREEVDSSGPRRLWMAWIVTLAMDVTSLKCLSGAVSQDNAYSQAEWNRRRMKLFLYLLRSPAWDKTTEPSVLRTASLFRRVPLLGRFVETYLWEWLLYWKHPFVSEEE
jgi:hypothetical protein